MQERCLHAGPFSFAASTGEKPMPVVPYALHFDEVKAKECVFRYPEEDFPVSHGAFSE